MPTKTTKPAEKPVRKIIKKRRKKSKIYFGTPVQNAIIRYNECPNPAIRNRIYRFSTWYVVRVGTHNTVDIAPNRNFSRF